MVPKLHKKGASFKGAAAYLLHDKGRAASSERVAWTQARNLAVNDPQMAWRIMAATAMDQGRLKALAGIKATGRKSSEPVLHLTLSWHPEEKERLTQAQMKLAANDAIRALGADDHQALIIAHNDDDHPHVHILLNRVNPNDGRMLPSSKEKLNLSRWAEAYEKERGKIYCEERISNNEARERGDYTRGAKDQPRHIFEEIRAGLKIANNNRVDVKALRKTQKSLDAVLSKRRRDMATIHSAAWKSLQHKRRDRAVEIVSHVAKTKERLLGDLRFAYKPQWETLRAKHRREVETFDARETTLKGRFQNAIETASEALTGQHDNGRPNVRDAFKAIVSKSARYAIQLRRHRAEALTLQREERFKERKITAQMKEMLKFMLLRSAMEYLDERNQLIKSQSGERKSLRSEWRQRRAERRRDWHDFSRKTAPKEKLKSDFTRSAEGFAPRGEAAKERIRQRLREARDKDKGRDGR